MQIRLKPFRFHEGLIMSVIIKLAETKEEIDSLLRGRHKVYVEEEGYMSSKPDGRIVDRFDAYPTTANFIAIYERLIVGGVRFFESSLDDTCYSNLYDFSPHIPDEVSMIGCGGMLWLEQAYRTIPDLSLSLMNMGVHWAAMRKLRYIIGVINPKAANFFVKNGYKLLSKPMFDKIKQVDFIPVILDRKTIDSELTHSINNQQSIYVGQFD